MGKRANGEEVCCLYLSGFFLEECSVCAEDCCPLVRVLRLVDGERKPAMGYIYEAMIGLKKQLPGLSMIMKRDTRISSKSSIRDGRFSFIALCMQLGIT